MLCMKKCFQEFLLKSTISINYDTETKSEARRVLFPRVNENLLDNIDNML